MTSLHEFIRRTDSQSVRVARLAVIAHVIVWTGAIGSLVLVNSVADSPLAPSARTRANVTTVLPEGWAFFTRNPREPQTVLYRRGADTWERVSQRHADRANYFGLARFARAKMIELASLLDQIPPIAWHALAAGRDPLSVAVTPVRVRNPALRPLLCGDLLIVEREPIPWAWSTARQPVRMAGRVVVVSAACGHIPQQERTPSSRAGE